MKWYSDWCAVVEDFGGVVVAHQRQHAAVFGGAGQIGMAEDVAGAVDAGALAVPHGKDAVVFAFAAQLGLLGAPHRGGGQVLIDAALEADVALGQERCSALELAVETAQRRAAIAGNVARGIEPAAAVEFLLHQAEANQRLEPGDEHVAVAEVVFVVELDVAQRHGGGLYLGPRPVCPRGLDSARGPANAGDIGAAPPAAMRHARPVLRPSSAHFSHY